MPAKPLTDAVLQEAVDALREYDNNVTHAAAALRIPRPTLEHRLRAARLRNITALEPIAAPPPPAPEISVSALRTQLMRSPMSIEHIAQWHKTTPGHAMVALEKLRDSGANLQLLGDKYEIPKEIAPRIDQDGHELPVYTSRPDGTYVFGFTSDNHLGSKYAREDCLNWLYDEFAARGVDRVYNAGNWIDGEARFNRMDLKVHGMDAQCRYLAANYPQRPGIVTYAVAGDDHEGWYVQKEGVDIGRYAEFRMRDVGRTDWVDLGYMEAYISMRHAQTGKECKLHVMHPGGGSSYAISYTAQKIVECVPLDSEILTRTGWKRHDEIAVGDEVLGYNVQTDACEWTTVLDKHRGRAEVYEYSNDQFQVRCTENHKWAIEWESRGGANHESRVPTRYSRRERLLQSIDASQSRSRIIQAARAPCGEGMPAMERTDWLRRDQAVARVLSMNSGERRAFIEGLLLGEGTLCGKEDYRTVVFSQNAGPVCDAFRLACFMEGIATTDRLAANGSFKPDGESRNHRRVTMLSKRMRICDRLQIEDLGEDEVWCPTTGLGTWVMRQGDTITITGNSYDGGDKPAIVLIGHYHKLSYNYIRNVHAIQTGTTEDQTPFMRKKRLAAHVGGGICTVTQCPNTGAILSCETKFFNYFVKDYYNNRWSGSGDVTHADRSAPGGGSVHGTPPGPVWAQD